MNLAFRYILIPFLNWGQYIFYLLILFIAAGKRFDLFDRSFNPPVFFKKISIRLSYKKLIWSVLIFKVLYALIETFGQYYVWSSNSFTKFFLSAGAINFSLLRRFSGDLFFLFNNRFGYFLFYSWGRFWLEIVVSVIASVAFYLFLIFLKKYRERFFEEGETELGFLLSLMVGWSNFAVFLLLIFFFVVIVSVFKNLVYKDPYTTLGAPFLLAGLIVLAFGNYLVSLFGLMSLRV
ncbi:MAG: hypothetical protein M1155_00580 [Patescibacteria group bacterium]|nr:hypothetical protein [Patescibacteria group bacterium]